MTDVEIGRGKTGRRAYSLNEIGIRGRSQKAVLDQVAAQRILQSYFDALPHAATA